MKTSILVFCIVLTLLSSVSFSQPKATPKMDTAIAFVTQERTQLWLKRSDTAAYVVLKADANPNTNTNFRKINNLAYLDQTSDGKTMLLGGKFNFIPPWN